MKTKNKQLTLAYSGGLDTSYCIPYLKDAGYDIHAINVNTGGFTKKELQEIEARAMQLGAVKFESINIETEYWDKCVKFLLFGNVLRNNTYPLSVSSERPFQGLALLQYCIDHEINYFAHGSTGAGNDQIRFDILFQSLAAQIEIITPIRDQTLSRDAELAYLQSKGFEWTQIQKKYSINKGIWGTSVGGAETLTSNLTLPEEAYPTMKTKSEAEEVTITFDQGIPVAINDNLFDSPIALIRALDAKAGAYGIGRDIHVGDTILGIKGRVGFEAAAPLILINAHELLEKHTLTKWQIHWKKQLSDWYGMMLHEAQYLDPLMRNIESFLTDTQQNVTGKVIIKLLEYRFVLNGVISDNDLMISKFGAYGEENKAWTGADARGFTKILSNQMAIYYSVHNHKK
ncbi:MAG: argininosuccinate synthase [Saprospiraceae bacterium]|mgnify:CR=1 FL=1|jgi:argininosuccinate synthase